jgi:predicted RNA binding protein YcfA (HicA-like mRNA interferase family)
VPERQPRLTGRELLAALRRAGWEVVRQRGSHARLAHPAHAQRVTIAVHAGAIVKPGTLRGVLDQAGLTVDELIALL